MSFSFVPRVMAKKLTDVTPAFLISRDIKVLLCDLDNTISLKRHAVPPEKVMQWANELGSAGIEIIIFSNNRHGRARKTAGQLGVRCLERVGKPRIGGFLEAEKLTGVTRGRMALVGDQIFTDVLGANRADVTSIWVEPINHRAPHLWLRFLVERIVVALSILFGGCNYEKL